MSDPTTQEIELNECCPETEATNPKRDLFRRKAKRFDHLFSLKNPIPDEVKDNDDLKTLFKRWNFIPYAGTLLETGHSLLTWENMLSKLSATNNAAITKKINFAVGGKARVIRSVDPEFETGDELVPVESAEAKTYIEALKTFIEFQGGISKFHNRIGWQYESNGNGWIELSFASVMGQGRVSLTSHRTTNCMYLNTAPGENRAVAISPVWTDKYLKKHAPRVVPLYPVFRNDGGVLRTMFHLKAGDNEWYGRPPSEGADVYKYREVQDAIYQVRAAATNFTGQLLIEVEDDNPEFATEPDEKGAVKAGYTGFVNRMEENFTNKGDDPQSVYFASRPYGSKQMFVFQLSPNTKEQWYKVTGEMAENRILRAHGLTPRFMGFDVSNGFASDVYISDYILNVQPVIQDLHDEIMNFVNSVLTQAWKLVGHEEWNVYSLAFAPPIQSTVEEFKVGQDKAKQQTQPDNSKSDPEAEQEQPNAPDPKKKPDPNNDDEE